MKRTNKMIELMDDHVLNDKLSGFLMLPVVSNNAICHLFIIEISFQKHQVKLIHEVLFLLL